MGEEAAAGARLVAAGVQQRLDLAAPLLRVLEGGVLLRARALARGRVVAPAARVLVRRRSRGRSRRSGYRPVEEGAVVRDDREAAREAVDEALQALEPVEVEVVRRLVEQEQVEAGEQDRGERGAGRLAAGERRRLLVERDRQAELGAHRPRTASRSAPPSARKRSSAAAYASGLQSALCRFTSASASATPVRRAR